MAYRHRGSAEMLRVTVEVNAPAGQAIGVKEQIAMELERWGDTVVVSVEEITPEQMKLGGMA